MKTIVLLIIFAITIFIIIVSITLAVALGIIIAHDYIKNNRRDKKEKNHG